MCMELMCAHQWENLIVADVKLLKRDFSFYYHLLHKTSVVNYEFRNFTTYILCSTLNSRLLKLTVLKFSFIFLYFDIIFLSV